MVSGPARHDDADGEHEDAGARATLAALCQRVGARVPGWTQGPGSNISVKRAGELYIKASGLRLDAVGEPVSVAQLPLLPLRQALSHDVPRASDGNAAYAASLQRIVRPGGGRPSMETGFHAQLPGADVVHMHALVGIVLADLARTQAHAVAALLAQHGLRWAVLPAVVPGWALCQQVAATPAVDVLLLANHGIILQGEANALLSAWCQLEQDFLQRWRLHGLHDWLAGTSEVPNEPMAPRCYLFDVAVFWPRLMAVTYEVDSAGRRRLRADASHVDKDAVELWRANTALALAWPQLPSLPLALQQICTALPQERLRQRRFVG